MFNTNHGTDAATIPTTWDVQTIAAIAKVKTGPFGSALHERDYVKSGTPIVTVEHLGERGILQRNLPLVSDSDRLRLKSYTLRTGDIVLSRVGSVDRNALVGEAEDGWLFSGRLLRVRISSKSVLPAYLSYHFHSEDFKRRIRSVAVGQTMASLNTRILQGLRVALPPFPEQYAIADALSDVDSLLSTLEALIAKKRATKRAAMQQLLTGATRLPTFGDKWKVSHLGQFGFFSRGRGITREDASDSGLPCVRYGELYTHYSDYTFSLRSFVGPTVARSALAIETDDLLFAGSGETTEDIGRCVAYVGEERAYAGGDIIVFKPRCRDSVNSIYLGHLMNHQVMVAQKARMAQGNAVVHIGARELSQLWVELPPIDEQNAIAKSLVDMDAEINVLEQRLDKTRAIKQGMMQQLLTGRIRLVAPDQREATAAP